jgi:RNA polymerase sigma-70 factor (ECF subfamily)
MAGTTASAAALSKAPVAAPGRAPARSRESELASGVKALVLAGQRERARERFGELVACQQRRALRIAFHYLRDSHDADEAVQDAFLKVFTHITTYREDLPFEVWFTRILVNRCLDVRKARARRLKWALPMALSGEVRVPDRPTLQASAEEKLISDERRRSIGAAVDQLPNRQRAVFTLCHIAEHTTSEVSEALGLSEATVRVHLFRAVRKLRTLLAGQEATA